MITPSLFLAGVLVIATIALIAAIASPIITHLLTK